MTIHLPDDVESSIRAAIHGGLFASVDDAIAEAWRYLQRQRTLTEQKPVSGELPPDPLLGLWKDYGDEMDEIVADAYRSRRPNADPAVTSDTQISVPHKPIWEVVDELRKSVPPEELSKLPKDGAEQLDHYLYGSPKRPTA